MLRQVSGAIVGAHRGHSIQELAVPLLDVLRQHLPDIEITHFYAGTGMASNYKKWPNRPIEEMMPPGSNTFSMMSFPTPQAAEEGVDWTFRSEISTTSSRGTDCLILNLGFAEPVVRQGLSNVLSFCDHLATQVKAESGHLHDLEDFADQNQKGLHYFRMAGKTIDPNIIKYSPVLRQQIVDIEQHPCHLHVYRTVDFCAAWTMYLGSEFVAMTAVDPSCAEQLGATVVELDDQVWRVTLFEDPFAFDHEENIQKLWDFRSIFRIDEVAHEFVTVY